MTTDAQTWGAAGNAERAREAVRTRDVFPRCGLGCEHAFHGLPCIRLGCECLTSFVDREAS